MNYFVSPNMQKAQAAIPYGAPAADGYAYNGPVGQYFAQILANCFPQYTVWPNVRLNPNSRDSVPVTFMVCAGSRPVLGIIICSSKAWESDPIMNTIQQCQKSGIPVQRYYYNFRNEANYVINRLSKVLR